VIVPGPEGKNLASGRQHLVSVPVYPILYGEPRFLVFRAGKGQLHNVPICLPCDLPI
jgi:hypothetical protein